MQFSSHIPNTIPTPAILEGNQFIGDWGDGVMETPDSSLIRDYQEINYSILWGERLTRLWTRADAKLY